jgi:hypothetical protein
MTSLLTHKTFFHSIMALFFSVSVILISLFSPFPFGFATPSDAATCTLAGTPSSLTWATTGGDSVVFTNFPQETHGTVGTLQINPTTTTTYTLQVKSEGVVVSTCSTTVTPSAPVCFNPTLTIDDKKFTWSNGENTSFLEYYEVKFCDGTETGRVHGSWTGNPVVKTFDKRIEYVLACGYGCTREKTQTCPTPPPAPSCTMTASPNTILLGNSSTLSWTSENTQSASFSGGITQTALNGSASVSPSNTTLYTGTFVGTNGNTITCSAQVSVTTNPANPTCSLTANPNTINKGESSTISWSSTNASSMQWTRGDITTTTLAGSRSVSPSNSQTYTAVFTGTNGNTVICSDTVSIRSSGGGSVGKCINCDDDKRDKREKKEKKEREDTEVFLSSTYTQLPGFITLSQVPYTGFEASPLMAMLFWLVVALISLFIGYILSVKYTNGHTLSFASLSSELGTFLGRKNIIAYTRTPFAESEEEMYLPLSKEEDKNTTQNTYTENGVSGVGQNVSQNSQDIIERVAHREKILLSPKTIEMIQKHSYDTRTDIETFSEKMCALIVSVFAREDGWILLSEQRAENFFIKYGDNFGLDTALLLKEQEERQNNRGEKASATSFEKEKTFTPSYKEEIKEVHQKNNPHYTPPVVQKREEIKKEEVFTPEILIRLILRKDTEALSRLPRTLHKNNVAIESFIRDTIHILDAVYIYRIEGGNLSPIAESAKEELKEYSNIQLEKIITALIGSIDHTYNDSKVGFKIAMTKIIASIS